MRRINIVMLSILCLLVFFPFQTEAAPSSIHLEGEGTLENPYRITDVDDFVYFRDQVNSGKNFSGVYFSQEADLNLSGQENWEPIGIYESGNYFYGTYDGKGHRIYNLTILRPDDNAGLFGQLGGIVRNLGIESGRIESGCSGAIASHSIGQNVAIINCYNRADVIGVRAGGIADNFTGGAIIGCFNYGTVQGNQAAGIVGYNADAIIQCVSVTGELVNGELFTGEIERSNVVEAETFTQNYETFLKWADTAGNTWEQVVEECFEGEGTEKKPYLIQNAEDLCIFRDIVNAGYDFSRQWVRQCVDIDLQQIGNWRPIGAEETGGCFRGIYDGYGHVIRNLHTSREGQSAGFFDRLGGIVLNLGIESGEIRGDYVGAIARLAVGYPMVVNCYNKAELVGVYRAGGIVDDFSGGTVANCYNAGTIKAPESAAIASYSAARITECRALQGNITGEEFSGIEELSNSILPQLDEIANALNRSQYGVCTKTGFQHNNLFLFEEDGSFGGRENYRLHFAVYYILVLFLLCGTAALAMSVYSRRKQWSFRRIADNLQGRWNMAAILFVVCYLLSILFLTAGYICGDRATTKTFVWGEGDDAFMDFFNPLKALLNNNYAVEGFYSESGGTYPPLARALIWLCGQVISSQYAFQNAYEIRANSEGLILWVLIFSLTCMCIYGMYKKYFSSSEKLVPFALLFCYPMIFAFERGNIIIIAYAFTLAYFLLYDHENKAARILAYVCLGLAAAIKIYPALFGLVVVATKRKKDILECIMCGLIICLGPFAFVGGWDALRQYITNVTASSGANSYKAVPYYLNYTNVIGRLADVWNLQLPDASVWKGIFCVGVFFLAVGAIVFKEEYKRWLSIVLIVILLPGYSCMYMTLFYILPLLLLMKKNTLTKMDVIYTILITVMILPLNFLTGVIGVEREQLWTFWGSCGIMMMLLVVIDLLMSSFREIAKRRKKAENSLC